ncbi:unnamed protein product [Oppiella nova]|uniref:Cystatin domain-containing protein n=1 Tax=Oppiella nova TaxID=334625 RepID=A0A7R9QTL6_9ACAR|nr:unnamed protein product [Oppiella nova]CAG2173536.1 unnamed protein product [Oppiella nova]
MRSISLVFGLNTMPTTDPAGAVKDVDPNKPEVQEAIKFVFNIIHASIDSAHAITMGKSQMVSGKKYYITLEVNETDCDKSDINSEPCKVIRSEVCASVVLNRRWDAYHRNQVLSFNCKGI